MMVDFAIDAQRNQGLSPRAAIAQACALRFRPIMMTTCAAIAGALPSPSPQAMAPRCAARSAFPWWVGCSSASC